MKIRNYLYIILGLLVLILVIDVVFVHAHYHVWYHELHGFEAIFGLVGAFTLMIFSLVLGEFFLWRTTCSVLLEPEMAGFGNDSAKVKKWFVDDGDKVKSGQALVEFETDRGNTFTIIAPYDGRVSKVFIDELSYGQVGESVVDLTVSKHAMGHGKEEGSYV